VSVAVADVRVFELKEFTDNSATTKNNNSTRREMFLLREFLLHVPLQFDEAPALTLIVISPLRISDYVP
jgi:hypothetical protein